MVTLEQMMERQQVLADFGELALRSEDLDEVLTEACHLVARALGCDLAKVMEIEEDGQTLFVRAGIGWQPGVIGETRLPMGERSSETYSIKAGVPICVPDIRHEDRFIYPEFLREAGVVGMVNVPIFLPGGKAYGLLQVDSREAWDIGDRDTQFLRTYATILGPVIDRLHKVHALQQAADRNETLLHELQHRIKNNVGAIRSLVRMRMNKAKSEEVRGELEIVGDRIEALRVVHEQVYATKGADRLSLRAYVTELLQSLLALHEEAGVRLDARIEDVEIKSDSAIPLGLILNEFTTNSLKYAFDGAGGTKQGVIAVEAHLRETRLWIRIRDNGKGLPAKAQPPRLGSGTGMALMEGLSRQIGAKPEWASEGGTVLCLEFPWR
jgi:two-component sensor histidine kinase